MSIERKRSGDATHGSDFIVATLSVDFVEDLSSSQLEAAVTDINKRIKAIDSRLRRVFIEAERREDHDSQNLG